MNHPQISSKLKGVRYQFRDWNFQYTTQTDLLGEEGVCTDEKKLLLTKHLGTCLGHNRIHLPVCQVRLDYIMKPHLAPTWVDSQLLQILCCESVVLETEAADAILNNLNNESIKFIKVLELIVRIMFLRRRWSESEIDIVLPDDHVWTRGAREGSSRSYQHRPEWLLLLWQRLPQKHRKPSWGASGAGLDRAQGVKGRCASEPPRLGCVTGTEDAVVAGTEDASVASMQHMQPKCRCRHETVILPSPASLHKWSKSSLRAHSGCTGVFWMVHTSRN